MATLMSCILAAKFIFYHEEVSEVSKNYCLVRYCESSSSVTCERRVDSKVASPIAVSYDSCLRRMES